MRLRRLAGVIALSGVMSFATAPLASAAEIVVTHWSSLLYGVPYAIAMEKGYFKEEGVDVTGILSSKGGGTSVRNLMAGETLYAEVALPAALAAIKEGFPIKILAGGTDGSSSHWVSRADAKYDTPADLKGRRFAYSRPKSVSESSILSALASQGLSVEDVKMVAVGDFGAGMTALEHDKVDVAILPEPIYSLKVKEGGKFRLMNWFGAKVPRYTQTVGVATLDNIEKRGKEIEALVKARRRGVEFLYANPDEAAKILAEAYNLAPDVAAGAMTNILKLNPTWWNPGRLDYEGMANMSEALASIGLLKLPIDWNAVTDERFLPADLKRPAG